ncbi:hypothetical protein KUTeg_009461 [Tegillarca granosa]|uniref:C1q domain-containing protein n=1 Tax=Tegillarca granosa TaxID=220873 RepID=A0ABQ9F8Y7_TEGGR|nr:hypothetical protein KUTeg_009461 [Tegillarca granosa]
MELYFFFMLSILHCVCNGLRIQFPNIFYENLSKKSEGNIKLLKKPSTNIDLNAEKLTDKESVQLIKGIHERFVALETKVKLLEVREKSRDEVEKYLQKSITKLQKENKNLKTNLKLLQSAEIKQANSANQNNVMDGVRQSILGQSYRAVNSVGQNVHAIQGIPPNINAGLKTSTVFQHADIRDVPLTVLKPGTIRFNAQPVNRMTYSGNKIIQFPDVTFNVGNGFNNKTGIFNCPKSGLYIFGLTISASPNLATAYIFQNNNWVARTFVGSNFGTGSVISILQLNAGDRVMVVNAENQQNSFDQFSHFTGARISD